MPNSFENRKRSKKITPKTEIDHGSGRPRNSERVAGQPVKKVDHKLGSDTAGIPKTPVFNERARVKELRSIREAARKAAKEKANKEGSPLVIGRARQARPKRTRDEN